MTAQEGLKKAALQYFDSPAFRKFFTELARKFYHQGNFGKSVGFQKFSKEELSELMHFMGFSEWEWSKRHSISVTKFLQSYQESRFASLSFSTVLESVLGQPLSYKQEIFQAEQREYQRFESMLQESISGHEAYLSTEKKKSWLKSFKTDQDILSVGLTNLKKALDHLPDHFEKLPYFSYHLFRDPHRLDRSTVSGRLFFDYLESITRLVTQEPAYMGDAEWENAVYENFYLLKDDSFNAVQINGLTAYQQGKEVQMWTAAAQSAIAWNVPLKHILEVDRIVPFVGNKVLFIENSGVFSIICGAFPQLPIVCSSGQFRYSVWKIAEKLTASGVEIFYSGDLDPAGLQIAQKILRRFAPQVVLLLMDEAAYRKVPKEVELSEEHLRQLGSINEPSLIAVRDLMKMEKLAGYQEGLLEELFELLAQW